MGEAVFEALPPPSKGVLLRATLFANDPFVLAVTFHTVVEAAGLDKCVQVVNRFATAALPLEEQDSLLLNIQLDGDCGDTQIAQVEFTLQDFMNLRSLKAQLCGGKSLLSVNDL